MHGIAEIVHRVRTAPGTFGFVGANVARELIANSADARIGQHPFESVAHTHVNGALAGYPEQYYPIVPTALPDAPHAMERERDVEWLEPRCRIDRHHRDLRQFAPKATLCSSVWV